MGKKKHKRLSFKGNGCRSLTEKVDIITDTIKEKLRMVVSNRDIAVDIDDLVIVLPKEVYKKMMCYVMSSTEEISGLGLCRWDDREITVYDIILPKQENSAASTELDDEDVSKILVDLVKTGKDPAELRFWYHSHGGMKCFWSGTDDDCCEKLGGGDFFVSIVANRAKQMLGRIDIYKPFRITLSGIAIAIEDDLVFSIPQSIKDEVKEKVKTRTYPNYQYGAGFGYGRDDDWNNYKGSEFYENGVKKHWSRKLGAFEVYSDEKKRWIPEKDLLIKDYQAELSEEEKTNKTKPPAEWKDGKVVLVSGESFQPGVDYKKWGLVPPMEVFEYCRGHIEIDYLCGRCSYRKECDEFYTGMGGLAGF